MKHLTRARPSAVLTTVLIALTLPSTLASFEHGAQANPINCCDLQPSAPVGQTAATLKLTLHKWCIKDDPCPDPSKIQISRDGTPIARTWVLEDNATSCEYTAQETRIAIHHDYKVSIDGVELCHSATDIGPRPDAGPADLTTAKDAAQDIAPHADATHLPPAGGDTGCTVGSAGLASPPGVASPLGVVVPLSLFALGIIFRRRRRR